MFCYLLVFPVVLLKFELLPGFLSYDWYLRLKHFWMWLNQYSLLHLPLAIVVRLGGRKSLTAKTFVFAFSLHFTCTYSPLLFWHANPLQWTGNARMPHFFRRFPHASKSPMKLDLKCKCWVSQTTSWALWYTSPERNKHSWRAVMFNGLFQKAGSKGFTISQYAKVIMYK